MIVGLHPAKGSAVAVVLDGSRHEPAVAARDAFPLVPSREFTPGQPYHAADGEPSDEAERIVRDAIESARRHAREGLEQLVARLEVEGSRAGGLDAARA